MEKRKAFNFYRSYFEIAQELNDSDRLKFYDAILKKQFDNIDIDLDGVVKFAYLSQKHSIDKQIQGYFDKTKDPTFDPCQGCTQPPTEPPATQEKEKEEEQEKEKEQVTLPINKYASDIITNSNPDIDYEFIRTKINETLGTNHLKYNRNITLEISQLFKDGIRIADLGRIFRNVQNDEYHKNTNYKTVIPSTMFKRDFIDRYNFTKQATVEEKPKFRAPWD